MLASLAIISDSIQNMLGLPARARSAILIMHAKSYSQDLVMAFESHKSAWAGVVLPNWRGDVRVLVWQHYYDYTHTCISASARLQSIGWGRAECDKSSRQQTQIAPDCVFLLLLLLLFYTSHSIIFFTFYQEDIVLSIIKINQTHCLKITQNAVLEFLNFGIFHQFFVLLKLTCLVTLFDHKLQVFKNLPKLYHFLAFFINFCPFKM